MDGLQMRPLLLRDAYFLPLERDGLYMRTSHRVMTITDVPVFPWIERLAPYLTGKTTLGELTRNLPDDKRRLVCDLVSALHEHGMVRDVSDGLPHTLSAREQETYEAEITFLEAYADSPEHRFQRYRDQYVAIVGSGLVLEAAVNAALRSGVRRVQALLTDESPTDHDRLFEHVASAKIRDPEHVFELDMAPAAGASQSNWASTIRGRDAVLHLAERPMLARASLLDGACDASGVLLVQGVVLPGEAWIGPVAVPGRPATRWPAAWRRVRPGVGSKRAWDASDEPADESPFLTGAVPAIIANTAVFHLFTHVTETAEHDWTQHLTRVDLEILQTSVHRFHPHPLAMPADVPDDAAARARIKHLQEGDEQSDEMFSRAAITYLDERVGVFASIDEEACQQIPLWITRVTLSDPVDADRVDLTVAAGALDFASARYSAMRRATELYASLMFDPRRTIGSQPRLWALRLIDDQSVHIPSERVFTTAAEVRRGGMPIGLGSGATWQAGLTAGLLAWCELLTAREAMESGRPHVQLRRDALQHDALSDHLTALLDLTGSEPAIFDITGSLGVPTFACTFGGRVVALGSGLEPAIAARTALERALLVRQQGASGRPTDICPAWAQTTGWSACEGSSSSELPEPLRAEDSARALAAILGAAGHVAVAVPLDVDRHLAELAPHLVRVVLQDD